jgi:hypothetical protein
MRCIGEHRMQAQNIGTNLGAAAPDRHLDRD